GAAALFSPLFCVLEVMSIAYNDGLSLHDALPIFEGYQRLKKRIQEKLVIRGVPCFAAPTLRSEHYTDICHPLGAGAAKQGTPRRERKSTRLNSSHRQRSYAVFSLKTKKSP